MTMRLLQLRSNDLAARPRLRAPVFQHNIQVQQKFEQFFVQYSNLKYPKMCGNI